MSASVPQADACPACQPGIPDASPALTSEPANGGTLTTHQCGSCYARWSTWRTPDGWPAARKLEPISVQQAADNAAILGHALDEQDREHRHDAA
jgi:hypothetical protein